MTRAANKYERADHYRDLHKHDERPSDPVSARTVAMLARASSTSFDEAVSLIQSFAATEASHAVVKAVREQHARTMDVLDGLKTPVVPA